MNLKLATLLFVASSASARNLRADKPRRYLPASDSSSSDEVSIFRGVCIIPPECSGEIDSSELNKIAKSALSDYNSPSSSKSRRRHLSSSSGSSEDFAMEFRSCRSRTIEKEIESELSSADDSSSGKSRRIRRLQAPESSSSSGDTDLDLTCFYRSQLETARSGCSDELDLLKTASNLARDLNRRNLKGETDTRIIELPSTLACDEGEFRNQLREIIDEESDSGSSTGGSRE